MWSPAPSSYASRVWLTMICQSGHGESREERDDSEEARNMINTESATVVPFSPQEDARIIELQAEYGNQWTKNGRSLERDVPWQPISHRCMTLKVEADDALLARPPEFPGISELEVPASLADSNIFLFDVCGIQFWSRRSMDEHDKTVKEGVYKSRK